MQRETQQYPSSARCMQESKRNSLHFMLDSERLDTRLRIPMCGNFTAACMHIFTSSTGRAVRRKYSPTSMQPAASP